MPANRWLERWRRVIRNPVSTELIRHQATKLRAKAALARELSRNASDRQAEANLLSYAADLDREADELEDRETGVKAGSASRSGGRN